MTQYRARIDRAGWALVMGAGCVGAALALVGIGGGERAPLVLAWQFAVGATLGVVAIAGVGGPIWWLSQRMGGRRGRRGPIAAGVTGAGVAGLATLAVLTQRFGAGLPVADAATLAAVWTSAVASAAVAGFLGALVALAMWLVGYRPA